MTPAGASVAATDADFDEDGFPDVALGGGLREVGGGDDGVVLVVYGSEQGLDAQRTQAWSETDFGGPVTQGFGGALAFGDFDGDGFSDLAVGSADAPVDAAKEHAGFVRIIYGSPAGLAITRSQRWSQNSAGVTDHAESDDGFGDALIAANFGYGPQDDLAIGVHGEDDDAGAVNVLYGTSDGLSARHDQLWTQASPGIADSPEQDDAFGLTLIAGRFRQSGFADLAVGVYNETVEGVYGAGAVHIINGSDRGLTSRGSRLLTQPALADGKPGGVAAFSYAMAAGPFTGGPTDDLAIGAPFANNNTGTVTVVYGSPNGLRPERVQVWSQATPGIGDTPESDDTFGWSLAAGNFGRDTNGQLFADLAVRVPGETATSDEAGGAVTIIYGDPNGLTATGSQTLTDGFSSEASGIDVSWRRQLTAIRTGAQGLEQLVVGDEDWLRVVPTDSNGVYVTKHQKLTTRTLGHPDVWIGLADKVAG